MGTPDRLRGRLTHAEMPDLAFGHQLGQRADGLLDRYVRVDAVQVVQVDMIGAQVAQRTLKGPAHVLRPAVQADHLTVVGDLHAGLGGEDGRLPASRKGPAEKLFVDERAVALRGIQQGDAELQRAVDGGQRLALVGGAVEDAHAHAAQALNTGDQALTAECAVFHEVQSSL